MKKEHKEIIETVMEIVAFVAMIIGASFVMAVFIHWGTQQINPEKVVITCNAEEHECRGPDLSFPLTIVWIN